MIGEYLAEQATKKVAQHQKMALTDNDPIDLWSATAPWSDLLEGAGWSPTGVYDTCGPDCTIWTRPGEAGSAKSATAHEPGCLQYTTDTGWAPLHVWSDIAAEELGSRTLSKLQFVARTQFGGNTPEAMSRLGLASLEALQGAQEMDLLLQGLEWPPPARTARNRESDTESSQLIPGQRTGDADRVHDGGKVDLLGMLTGTRPPAPTPTILGRSDGNSLIYRGAINQLIGESESGKTWAALAGVAEVLAAGGRAAYVDIDGNGDAALVSRLIDALSCDLLRAVQDDRFAIFRPTDPVEFSDMVGIVARSSCDLVVIDSFGEAMPIFGLKTNDNDDATTFMANYLTPMAEAGTAVLVIDHVTKDKDNRNGTGIGAQAKKRRTDGAYIEVVLEDVFSARNGGSSKFFVRKDRHSGLNDATASDRYWGTFRLIPGAGYGIESAVPAAPDHGDALSERRELVEHRKVTLSRLLQARLDLADDMVPVSANRLKEDGVGFDSSKIKITLEQLLAAGCVTTFKAGRSDVWVSVKPYESIDDALDTLS